MLRIAHRGYSSVYNDNNIESFKKAIEYNFDFIEMDLQLNKENEIVVYHDNSIDRKLIKNLSNQEVKENNILFLKDFFQEIDIFMNNKKNILKNDKKNNIKLLFDLKGCDNSLAILLYDFLIHENINLNQIIIASFNLDYIKYIHRQEFKISIGFITSNNEFYIKPSIYKHIKYIIVDITTITNKQIKKLKKDNKIIFAYTCHNKSEIELFQNKSIDGIITNIKID